jgi:uncharacterized repeat protein (TIGR03806 family)
VRFRPMIAALSAASAGMACGSSTCTPGGGGGYASAPYPTLSEYCLVEMTDAGIQPKPGVLPYDLNTPLFSDYAVKLRTVWVPPGVSASYDPDGGVIGFPDGTLISKSFGMRDDLRKTKPQIHWIETRILAKVDGRWHGYAYAWNDAQSEATYNPAGQVQAISFVIWDGGTLTANYLVPSQTQCIQCHQSGTAMEPIGPKARQLNKDYAYADGGENQLVRWGKVGFLNGAPDPSSAPKLPVWNDVSTGTVEQRARAYLEGNCAHCHNPDGFASNTGLTLWASESDSAVYGVCKVPSAAGLASNGFCYDVVPGDPDHSILSYRIGLTGAGSMPPVSRSVVDAEGAALVHDWIAGLSGSCQAGPHCTL